MASSVEFAHKGVVLNACCMMDLFASRQIMSILKSLPVPVMVADYVRDREGLSVYREGQGEGADAYEKIEFEPLISAGVLSIASLIDEDEMECFTRLAASLEADGEAMSGALAIQRGWALGIDDPWCTSMFNMIAPDLPVLSTPMFLHYWAVRAKPPAAEIRAALQNVRRYARYRPDTQHPLYPWWQEHMR